MKNSKSFTSLYSIKSNSKPFAKSQSNQSKSKSYHKNKSHVHNKKKSIESKIPILSIPESPNENDHTQSHHPLDYFPKEKNQRYIVLDTETTGLNYEKDNLIAINAIEIINCELTGIQFNAYITPRHKKYMKNPNNNFSYFIEDYANERDNNAYKTLKSFIDFVGESFIITHNVPYDMHFINKSLKENNLPTIDIRKCICSLLISRKKRREKFFRPFNMTVTLGNLCKLYGINVQCNDLHHGNVDASVLARVICKMWDDNEVRYLGTDNSSNNKNKGKVKKEETNNKVNCNINVGNGSGVNNVCKGFNGGNHYQNKTNNFNKFDLIKENDFSKQDVINRKLNNNELIENDKKVNYNVPRSMNILSNNLSNNKFNNITESPLSINDEKINRKSQKEDKSNKYDISEFKHIQEIKPEKNGTKQKKDKELINNSVSGTNTQKKYYLRERKKIINYNEDKMFNDVFGNEIKDDLVNPKFKKGKEKNNKIQIPNKIEHNEDNISVVTQPQINNSNEHVENQLNKTNTYSNINSEYNNENDNIYQAIDKFGIEVKKIE